MTLLRNGDNTNTRDITDRKKCHGETVINWQLPHQNITTRTRIDIEKLLITQIPTTSDYKPPQTLINWSPALLWKLRVGADLGTHTENMNDVLGSN